MTKGPSVKKYYTATNSICVGDVCTPSPPVTDFAHYVWEDTLVSCPP